jgi:hypothetical protein
MAPKSIYPRTNDDSGKRSSGDPIRAYLHNFALEKKSRLPATTSPYVDVDSDSDDDLRRYHRRKEEEPHQIPQRPPVELLVQALESFADKPLAKMGPRTKQNTEAYKQALSDFRNLVNCPMPNCSGGATTETVLLDHWRERHPEILRYDSWLRDQVRGPYLHSLEQREDAEEDFYRCEQEIRRRQPLLEELQKHKGRIEDKHGMSDAYVHGIDSPEYQLAEMKAKDELEPLQEGIAEVQREITGYEMRQRQAERQYNFAQRKIEEMEKDSFIKPLLEPINLAAGGGKQTWRFDEERRELEPIVLAIARGIASEKFASGDTGIPSKGTLYRDENKYTTSEIQNWTPDAYGNNDYG